MAILTSIIQERFRKNFLVFFLLSSTIPLLVMVFIIYKHVVPLLMPAQITDLHAIFSYGVLVMLVPPFLSYILGTRWVKLVEALSENVKTKSINIMGERQDLQSKNEFVHIHESFNDLHDELQNKMSQLNEVSKKLIDSNVKLNELAVTDQLTSLYNRRYFDLRLMEEVSRSDRYKQEISLIMIDFDDFKQHNDAYGHQTGDKLLWETADLIRKSVRESDMVFRYGGDEFAVLVPGCNIKRAEQLANGLVKKVSKNTFEDLAGRPLNKITISCGVAWYKGNLKEFVAEVDKHLFTAKTAGKGNVVAQM